ncbi:hypothetical protein AB0F45_35245, partial [Streptomyces achromogenes]
MHGGRAGTAAVRRHQAPLGMRAAVRNAWPWRSIRRVRLDAEHLRESVALLRETATAPAAPHR